MHHLSGKSYKSLLFRNPIEILVLSIIKFIEQKTVPLLYGNIVIAERVALYNMLKWPYITC